jgi:hypothetical protein
MLTIGVDGGVEETNSTRLLHWLEGKGDEEGPE